MDGTTLNSNHVMSQNTVTAINNFAANDVRIVFATGRMESAVKTHLEKINTDGIAITHNGGLIKNLKTGEVLSRKVVPPAVVKEVVSFSNTSESIIHINTDDEVLILKDHELSKRYATELGINLSLYKPEIEMEIDPISLLLIGEKEKLSDYIDYMQHEYQGKFDHVFMPWIENKWMLQILAPNTSKGQAVIELSNLLGFNPGKEVISFGDSYNDIEMIAGTYFGVAMNNACKELKDVANYVTKSNDLDGVAYVLNQLEINEQRFMCDF